MYKTTAELFRKQTVRTDCQRDSLEGYCEIINGELSPVPAHGTKHQHIKSRLTAYLLQKLENTGRGTVLGAPCNVMLSPWDIIKPDILFVRRNRTGIIGERIILGSPDLVVEILSSDTCEKDMKEKRKIYAESGIAEYWIVDPEAETVEIQIWSELGYISTGTQDKKGNLSSLLLHDICLNISDIFALPFRADDIL